MRHRRRSFVGAALIAAAFGACLYPNEVSRQLAVQLDDVPVLVEGDSVTLSAHLDDAGRTVPNAQIVFSIADSKVASVSANGRLVARDSGTTTLSAAVVGFDGVAPAQRAIVVHSRVEVDSLVPTVVRFGDTLTLFGAGLDPASLYSVQLGGFTMQPKSFVPADAAHPERFGRLSFYAAPPAAGQSLVQVTTQRGSRLVPIPVTVQQRDIFEPNDTVPAHIVLPISNPGLAMELPSGRSGSKELVDWYTFTLATPSDVTIRVRSPYAASGGVFSVLVTDSLSWSNGFFLGGGSRSWAIGSGFGTSASQCHGKYVKWSGSNVPYQAQADVDIALGSLPAGTYHLYIPFTQSATIPLPYELDVVTSYQSVLPRDAFEENDYCNVAASLDAALASGNPAQLTIDNPLDIDWFKGTAPPGGEVVVLEVNAAVDSADIDMYFVKPGADTVVSTPGIVSGPQELAAATLPAGNFLFMTADYAGVPTDYTLARVRTETEPNNDAASADTVVLSPTRTVNLWGTLDPAGDTDYVAFHATAGTSVSFKIEANWFDSPTDTYLVLEDSAGGFLTLDDDGGYFHDSWLTYDVTTSGWYRLLIMEYPFETQQGGPAFYWVLRSNVYSTSVAAQRAVAAGRRGPSGITAPKVTATPGPRAMRQTFDGLSPGARLKLEAVRQRAAKFRALQPRQSTTTGSR